MPQLTGDLPMSINTEIHGITILFHIHLPMTLRPRQDRPASQSILEFWTSGGSDYFVDWTYNPKTNLYARANGGKPHMDKDTGKQLTAKNVVVLEMIEDNANDGYVANDHLLFENKGTGKAVVFKDGKRINGTWAKDTRTSQNNYYGCKRKRN